MEFIMSTCFSIIRTTVYVIDYINTGTACAINNEDEAWQKKLKRPFMSKIMFQLKNDIQCSVSKKLCKILHFCLSNTDHKS